MKTARTFVIPALLALAALTPRPARAQAAASLVPMPRAQFFDSAGRPLAGGCVWTYAAGSTTPLNSYRNASGTANPNPVVLDSAGRGDIWLGAGSAYKISVSAKTSAGCVAATTPLYTADNVIDQGFGLVRQLQNGSLAIGLRGLPIAGTGGGVGVGNAMLSATVDGLYVSVNGAAPELLTGGGAGGGGTPAGPATSLQYNNGGTPAAFAGSANLKWDNGGRILVICGAPATGCTNTSGVASPLFASFGAAADKAFITNVTGGAVGSSYVTNDGNAYYQGVNVTNTFNSLATGPTLAITQASKTFNITGAGDAGFQTMGLGLHATPTTGFGGGVNVGEALLSATTAGLYLSLNGAPPALVGGGGGSGTPGLPATSIQYNNAGTFAGSANLLWDNGLGILTLTKVGPNSSFNGPIFVGNVAAGGNTFENSDMSFHIDASGNGFYQGLAVTATFNSLATGVTKAVTQQAGTFFITGAGDASFQSTGLGLKASPVTGIGGGVGVGEARLSATTAGLYISLNGAAPVLVGGGGGSGTPGAPTTSIQFNNAGTFAGSANLLWDNTNGIVTLTKVGATSAIIAPIFSGNVAAGGNTFKNSDGSFTIDAAGNALFQTVRASTTFQSLATGAALALSTAGSPGASINGQGDGSFRSLAIAGGAYGLNNSGQLTVSSCIGCVGTAAGANTQVQFNNGGVFGASANMTWDGGSSVLHISGPGGSGVIANTFNGGGSAAFAFQTSTNSWNVDGNGNQSQTGTFSISSGAANATISLLSNVGLYRSVNIYTGGSLRWQIGADNTGEGGSNTGTGFFVTRRNDSAALIDNPIYIQRSDGIVRMVDGWLVNSYGLTAAGVLNVASCTGCGAGVTSLTSGGNGLAFSASIGAITASLAQDIRTTANPTFANLTVSSCTGCGGGASVGGAGTIQFSNGSGGFNGSGNLFWNNGLAAMTLVGTLTQTTGILTAPEFSCQATGLATCITSGTGSWSINGNGSFLGQAIATGANNGTSATGGQGATISNSGSTIGMVVYDTGGHCNIGTGSFACASDERLKRNIAPIGDALKAVIALRPVAFDWRGNGEHGFGFIAQEVQKVLPGLVTTDKGGYLELSEMNMIPYLVRSIQQLQAEVDTLRSRVGVRLLNEQLSK